jgi:hypothetical protein
MPIAQALPERVDWLFYLITLSPWLLNTETLPGEQSSAITATYF